MSIKIKADGKDIKLWLFAEEHGALNMVLPHTLCSAFKVTNPIIKGKVNS